MGEHINPLQFCQASSTDFSTFVPNGGGACVQGLEPYNSGNGMFVADLYDCVPVAQSMENVKQVFQGVYDVHPSADGICCPNRGLDNEDRVTNALDIQHSLASSQSGKRTEEPQHRQESGQDGGSTQ